MSHRDFVLLTSIRVIFAVRFAFERIVAIRISPCKPQVQRREQVGREKERSPAFVSCRETLLQFSQRSINARIEAKTILLARHHSPRNPHSFELLDELAAERIGRRREPRSDFTRQCSIHNL